MALQYLDKEGLEHFWKNTKEYIDKTDEKLQSEIDAITGGDGSTSLASLQEALNQEISDRTEADNTLQSNIDSEVSARSEKDTELQSNIEAEAAAREEADTNLSTRIDELGTGNQEALETLEAKVDQEIEERIAGDAALLGTEEDAKELNTIYGLRAQIEYEASEADGAVNILREEIAGGDILVEGKIPSTHTLDALSTRTTTLETLTAGDWRAQNDEGIETNTIKSYIDLKSDRIPDSEITDLMDKLNG